MEICFNRANKHCVGCLGFYADSFHWNIYVSFLGSFVFHRWGSREWFYPIVGTLCYPPLLDRYCNLTKYNFLSQRSSCYLPKKDCKQILSILSDHRCSIFIRSDSFHAFLGYIIDLQPESLASKVLHELSRFPKACDDTLEN